tara:strand:- start:1452 stop:1715 length:264 start_codon:yes stop_codon:yes gene_type:complete
MGKMTRVRSSVSELVTFAKEKCTSNLNEAVNRGDIKVDENDLRKVIGLIDLSVSQAFSLGFGNVESALSEYEKSLTKTSKRARSRKK